MRCSRTLAVAVLAGALATGPATARWIGFPAAPGAAPGAGAEPYDVRAYLQLPAQPGRHPAVVLLPGCDGREAFHRGWAEALAQRGHVTLLVDHYFMHDRGRTCDLGDAAAAAELRALRMRHALGAARHLAARPEVDRARIAVMGWGDAPVADLLHVDVGATGDAPAFAAGTLIADLADLRRYPGVTLDETEQVQHLLGGGAMGGGHFGVEREGLDAVALHGATQLALEEGLHEQGEEVDEEQRLDTGFVFEQHGRDLECLTWLAIIELERGQHDATRSRCAEIGEP